MPITLVRLPVLPEDEGQIRVIGVCDTISETLNLLHEAKGPRFFHDGDFRYLSQDPVDLPIQKLHSSDIGRASTDQWTDRIVNWLKKQAPRGKQAILSITSDGQVRLQAGNMRTPMHGVNKLREWLAGGLITLFRSKDQS